MVLEQVKDSTESNLVMFFGAKSEYLHRFPEASNNFNEAIGYFVFHHNEEFFIESGHLFVDVHNTTLQIQKHILREELTQALGLPTDTGLSNSIFYDKPSSITNYSIMDKEVIRLLYRPEISPGMGEEKARDIAKGLLCL